MKLMFAALLTFSTTIFSLQSAYANNQESMAAFEGIWAGECKNSAGSEKYHNELKVEAATLQSITLNGLKYTFDQTVKFETELGNDLKQLLLVHLRKSSQPNRFHGTSYRIIHDWNLYQTKTSSTDFEYYLQQNELVRVAYIKEDAKETQWTCRYQRQ